MQIDWVALTTAIPYAGIAIIFGIFMLRLIQLNNEASEKRQERQDKKDAERDTKFLDAIDKHANQWQTFLREERELDRASRSEERVQVAADLKSIVQAIGIVQSLVSQHDLAERAFWEYAKDQWTKEIK